VVIFSSISSIFSKNDEVINDLMLYVLAIPSKSQSVVSSKEAFSINHDKKEVVLKDSAFDMTTSDIKVKMRSVLFPRSSASSVYTIFDNRRRMMGSVTIGGDLVVKKVSFLLIGFRGMSPEIPNYVFGGEK